MNTFEVPLTEDNLVNYLERDSIERNQDISRFYKLLEAQNSSCAIAIDGRWGSGKTVFVKQLKLLIEALNVSSNMKEETRSVVKSRLGFQSDDHGCSFAVYYDAWKNDHDSEPMYSLIYEITRQLHVDFSLSDINIPKQASGILKVFSGLDLTGVVDAFDEKNPFKVFTEEKNIEDKVESFINSIVPERGNRLVLFVDELDRCKPAYAVKLLEQIKHYIVDDRITFVFSVNLEQLQHTIKHCYGSDFDACRYLDRFFNLRINLPPANMKKFYAEIGMDASPYLVETVMKRIIMMFHFELREITRFYTQVKASFSEATDGDLKYGFNFLDGNGRHLMLLCVVPLLIGLEIADVSRFDNFINGKDGSPLIDVFDGEDTGRILKGLLDRKESFADTDGMIRVTYEEITQRLYKAIFVQKYNNGSKEAVLGQYKFDESSKRFALSVAGMMSKYTMA